MRVAVVDDDYAARTLISEFLEDDGHVVDPFDHPHKLGDLQHYDAIVMDVMIGSERYAGLDYILDQKRQNRIGAATKVIFISNFGQSPEILRRLTQVRDCRWLDKPIDLPELAGIIHENL
jgi:CheY-like chemotaxis protein